MLNGDGLLKFRLCYLLQVLLEFCLFLQNILISGKRQKMKMKAHKNCRKNLLQKTKKEVRKKAIKKTRKRMNRQNKKKMIKKMKNKVNKKMKKKVNNKMRKKTKRKLKNLRLKNYLSIAISFFCALLFQLFNF